MIAFSLDHIKGSSSICFDHNGQLHEQTVLLIEAVAILGINRLLPDTLAECKSRIEILRNLGIPLGETRNGEPWFPSYGVLQNHLGLMTSSRYIPFDEWALQLDARQLERSQLDLFQKLGFMDNLGFWIDPERVYGKPESEQNQAQNASITL